LTLYTLYLIYDVKELLKCHLG